MILHDLVDHDIPRVIRRTPLGGRPMGRALRDGLDRGGDGLRPFMAQTDPERPAAINTVGPVRTSDRAWCGPRRGAIPAGRSSRPALGGAARPAARPASGAGNRH